MENLQKTLFGDDHSAYTVKTDSFEGPLDLLLYLIKKNEVDICNIPIAVITSQYLEYLELLKELNLDVAGDFLVMASTLIQIKSRLLLPVLEPEAAEPEEGDPRAELVQRLLEYQRYREAAERLGECELLGREVFARKFEPREFIGLKPEETLPEMELFELIDAFRNLLATIPEATFHEVGAEGMTIADRINDILDLLRGTTSSTLQDLFTLPLTREYVIVTFLALLELCKLRMVKLLQAEAFGTIFINMLVLGGEQSLEEDYGSYAS